MASRQTGLVPAQLVSAEHDTSSPASPLSTPPLGPPGVVEIDMPNGTMVRVGQGADLTVLRTVLAVLDKH